MWLVDVFIFFLEIFLFTVVHIIVEYLRSLSHSLFLNNHETQCKLASQILFEARFYFRQE